MAHEQAKRVCVTGAGVAGLVTAKVLKHDGFDVTLFEKEPTIGGVWAPSRAYVGLCTNNPHEHYAFSDFRYPETCDEFPTAGQVLEYLQAYTRHFGLEPHLSLSTEADSCTLVFRRPHWMFPRYFPGDTRVDEMIGTRFSEKILPAYHRVSRLETTLRTVLAPVLWLWRRVMSKIVSRTCNMPPEMVPQQPVTTAAENLGIGTRFYQALQEGLARAKRTEIQSFSGAHTLHLGTGERINADLVIFATGWQQDVSILDPALRQKVRRNGKFHLYRHIVPPTEQRLAFNGYASAGNQAITSEIAAHWLSECFRGNLDLPDVSTMEEKIAERHDWASEVIPGRNEGYFAGFCEESDTLTRAAYGQGYERLRQVKAKYDPTTCSASIRTLSRRQQCDDTFVF